MAAPTIFAPAYTFVDAQLDQFLNARLSSVMSEVSGPLRVALVLYVVLYGFAILRGAIHEPIMDFSVRSLKLAFILTIATTAAYSDYITQPLFHVLPDTLARAISGTDVPNIGASFDKFLGYGGALSAKISQSAGVTDFGAYVTAGVVFVVTVIATALGFGVTMVAKVALALLVALGPIFVACALFNATRRYFFGWLSQGVNYLTLFALIITVFELVLALVQQQWPNIDGQANAEVAGMLFSALCLLGAIFFLQTPAIAAGIAGGASAGLADFATAMAGSRGGASERSAPSEPSRGRSGGSLAPAGSGAPRGASAPSSPSR